MILSFEDQGTEDIYNGTGSRAARRTCPQELWPVARRKLDQIEAAVVLSDLAAPPGNRLEPLQGDREGQHSIRINGQYRICFFWRPEGAEAVEINNHYRP